MDETLSYTVKQAVERTGYSRAWLYELLAAGKLQAKKDGRKTSFSRTACAATSTICRTT